MQSLPQQPDSLHGTKTAPLAMCKLQHPTLLLMEPQTYELEAGVSLGAGCQNHGTGEYDNLQRYQIKRGGGKDVSGTMRSQGSSRVLATWPRGQGACQQSSPSDESGHSATWCPFGATHESPQSVVCVECPPCRCIASAECKQCRQHHPLVGAL